MIRQTFTRAGNAPDLGALSTPIRTAIGDPFYLNAQALTAVKNEAATV
jgi:hypothetical protein